MRPRELRFLVALATYLTDDALSVRVGFATLTEESGLSRRWARVARADLSEKGHLAYKPGLGRGHLTLWTVLCLPEKGYRRGASIAGAEKGHPTADKRGTLLRADQGERDRRLNHQAKSGRAALIDLVIEEIEQATGRRIGPRWAQRTLDNLLNGHAASNAGGFVRAAIRNERNPRQRFLSHYDNADQS